MTKPDLQKTSDPKAIFVASEALASLGEKHALIGGAAVSAYGVPRVGKAHISHGVPILQVEPLVVLKLRANSRQDRMDVRALVNLGCVVEAYIHQHEPELLPRLRRALE